MNLSFVPALEGPLTPERVARIVNQARTPEDYLFNTILPEREVSSYTVSGGDLVIRATMAGLAGMDSPYPNGGLVETSDFLANTGKVAIEVSLNEATQRHLQDYWMRRTASNRAPTTEEVAREALNFLQKLVIQPQLDTAEWLRGQALVNHAINWEYSGTKLKVDYKVPASQRLTARTGDDAYGGSASKFWADHRALDKALRRNVRARILNSNTLDAIVSNPVNQLIQTAENGSTKTFRRYVDGQFTPDAMETVTYIVYDREGEIIDPANRKKTIRIPFMPDGAVLAIANGGAEGYIPGQGSTEGADTNTEGALGYTHLAPTVEGGGQEGRWGELYVPQREPMKLNGRGVSNILPVIQSNLKLAVAKTDL